MANISYIQLKSGATYRIEDNEAVNMTYLANKLNELNSVIAQLNHRIAVLEYEEGLTDIDPNSHNS